MRPRGQHPSSLRCLPRTPRWLPPLHLMAAGIDPLLSDTLNLEARLAALGRPERTNVVPGVVHGFLQMSHDLPQAREALGRAADFVKSRI